MQMLSVTRSFQSFESSERNRHRFPVRMHYKARGLSTKIIGVLKGETFWVFLVINCGMCKLQNRREITFPTCSVGKEHFPPYLPFTPVLGKNK